MQAGSLCPDGQTFGSYSRLVGSWLPHVCPLTHDSGPAFIGCFLFFSI